MSKLNIPQGNPDQSLYNGDLGLPVFTNLIIENGTYFDDNGVQKTYPGFAFDTVVIQIELQKMIHVTKIQGRESGSVKEYIGMDDFKISIDIDVLSNQNNVYPQTEMDNLMQTLRAPVALKVNSKYLNSLGVFYIVVEKAPIRSVAGEYSQKYVHLECLSDEPLIGYMAQLNNP